MVKYIKFDITEEMYAKIEKMNSKNGTLSINQYIAKVITEYVLSTKVSAKINDNRYQILQLLIEELKPLKERYERIMDRIEEDYVYIREGVNDDE